MGCCNVICGLTVTADVGMGHNGGVDKERFKKTCVFEVNAV